MVGFKVGQKVVYPNHGIGTIEQIEQKQIGAIALPFYTLRLAATNSLVLVPVSNASEVGLRRPISSAECDTLFTALSGDFATPANDWKDRFKDFSDKMRTGNIFEVAEVLKHLHYPARSNPCHFANSGCLSGHVTWWYRNSPQSAANPSAISNPASTMHLSNLAHGMNAGPTGPPAPQPQAVTEVNPNC